MIIEGFSPFTYKVFDEEVISPPFDSLTQELMEKLLKNKHNILNLLNNVEKSSEIFNQWVEDNTVVSWPDNSVILLKQEYFLNGKKVQRYGVIALIDISLEENFLIPHEDTIPDFVEKRKKYFLSSGLQNEPVFVIVKKPGFAELLSEISSKYKCNVHFMTSDNKKNEICILSQSEEIEKIKKILKGSQGIIADGHHRTRAISEIYRETGDNFWKKMLVYITDISDESTAIMEIHRYFENVSDLRDIGYDPEKLIEINDSFENKTHRILSGGKTYREQLNVSKPINEIEIINRRINDIQIQRDIMAGYTPSIDEVMEKVEKGAVAIIMPKVTTEEFYSEIINGKKLPPKSTYFYPKIPSGIVFYANCVKCHCSSAGRAADS
ncbi:DUF1015 family protein [Caldiplasma sukawensis]